MIPSTRYSSFQTYQRMILLNLLDFNQPRHLPGAYPFQKDAMPRRPDAQRTSTVRFGGLTRCANNLMPAAESFPRTRKAKLRLASIRLRVRYLSSSGNDRQPTRMVYGEQMVERVGYLTLSEILSSIPPFRHRLLCWELRRLPPVLPVFLRLLVQIHGRWDI